MRDHRKRKIAEVYSEDEGYGEYEQNTDEDYQLALAMSMMPFGASPDFAPFLDGDAPCGAPALETVDAPRRPSLDREEAFSRPIPASITSSNESSVYSDCDGGVPTGLTIQHSRPSPHRFPTTPPTQYVLLSASAKFDAVSPHTVPASQPPECHIEHFRLEENDADNEASDADADAEADEDEAQSCRAWGIDSVYASPLVSPSRSRTPKTVTFVLPTPESSVYESADEGTQQQEAEEVGAPQDAADATDTPETFEPWTFVDLE